jgi:RHS repeat-associated protein
VRGWLYADDLLPSVELDGSGAVTARFVYGTKPVPDYMERGGTRYRILADHLGSPRLVVDAATGAIAQRIDYDEFGVVTRDTNPGFQPFGYAGGLYDPDTGLVRFGARDYDASVGRWTAKDPLLFGGEDANLYSYVGNSPLNETDPTGELRPPPPAVFVRPPPGSGTRGTLPQSGNCIICFKPPPPRGMVFPRGGTGSKTSSNTPALPELFPDLPGGLSPIPDGFDDPEPHVPPGTQIPFPKGRDVCRLDEPPCPPGLVQFTNNPPKKWRHCYHFDKLLRIWRKVQ